MTIGERNQPKSLPNMLAIRICCYGNRFRNLYGRNDIFKPNLAVKMVILGELTFPTQTSQLRTYLLQIWQG